MAFEDDLNTETIVDLVVNGDEGLDKHMITCGYLDSLVELVLICLKKVK